MILTSFLYYEGIAKGQWKLNFIFGAYVYTWYIQGSVVLGVHWGSWNVLLEATVCACVC